MAFGIVVERDVEMRARDGVRLLADVYRPDAPGRFPVLILRTPYGREGGLAGDVVRERDFYPPLGYVVVVQDCRGRHGSEGDFEPFLQESLDGYDTVEWAAGLPWSDGMVGMLGQSYCATTQYRCAPERPPHLRALSPVAGPANPYRTCIYRDGALELNWVLTYFSFMGLEALRRSGDDGAFDAYLRHPERPLSPLRRECLAHRPLLDWGPRLRPGAPYVAEFLAHPVEDAYWQARDDRRRAADVATPMLHVGSWYDAFQDDTLAMFAALRHGAATPEAREGQRLLMGPWAHQVSFARPTSRGTGDADFGLAASIELHEVQRRFFDRHLKGVASADADPPVRLFVMGDNRWRDEDDWPLARARAAELHLRAGGTLSLPPPDVDEAADHFDYDPLDPVPTRGGMVLGLPAGVLDQRPVEARPDVLTYTSEPLADELEVTGKVHLVLHLASTAPETDVTAKVVDVRPDGYAANIVEGIARVRPPCEVTVDLWSTSHVFGRGHRIRVDVTSSSFPRWDPNPNTGEPFGRATSTMPARQTLFHDRARPSRLVLPVIPDRGDIERAW